MASSCEMVFHSSYTITFTFFTFDAVGSMGNTRGVHTTHLILLSANVLSEHPACMTCSNWPVLQSVI